jgi:hypothetical protein
MEGDCACLLAGIGYCGGMLSNTTSQVHFHYVYVLERCHWQTPNGGQPGIDAVPLTGCLLYDGACAQCPPQSSQIPHQEAFDVPARSTL